MKLYYKISQGPFPVQQDWRLKLNVIFNEEVQRYVFLI
jgi:hypothetical protein